MTTPEISKIAVDERACAAAIGMSVVWLRKDRRGKRLLPYYKIGGSVRYNLDRVREALAELEEGGTKRPGGRRTKTAEHSERPQARARKGGEK